MKHRKPVVPPALALQIAEFAQAKGCSEQTMLECALQHGLSMLKLRSDQFVTVVRRKEEDARSL